MTAFMKAHKITNQYYQLRSSNLYIFCTQKINVHVLLRKYCKAGFSMKSTSTVVSNLTVQLVEDQEHAGLFLNSGF